MQTENISNFIYSVYHFTLEQPRHINNEILGLSWSYGNWINNQCLSSLTLWVRIALMARSTRYNITRLLHDIFHIGPGISPRLPYKARQRSWRAYMGRGLIPGTIWKMSCHNLFIICFTLTFFRHWLLYCRKDLWTDKLRK